MISKSNLCYKFYQWISQTAVAHNKIYHIDSISVKTYASRHRELTVMWITMWSEGSKAIRFFTIWHTFCINSDITQFGCWARITARVVKKMDKFIMMSLSWNIWKRTILQCITISVVISNPHLLLHLFIIY